MTVNTMHHPICAVCKHPVERAKAEEDYDAFGPNGLLLTVYCHGEREEHQLSRADMEHATSIEIGEVFRRSLPEGDDE